jgi:uncharacterized membrane protein YphA (DoxX/SURF4 family)
MMANPDSKLPHTLRLVVFFLRLALGLDFVNLGLTAIFDPGMRHALNGRSLGDLSAWLATVPKTGALQTILAWVFLIVGICLILGFLTRLASIAGVVALAVPSLAPAMTLVGIAPVRFIGDNIIVILCLCIVMIARAGEYFGVDRFIHLRARRNDGG